MTQADALDLIAIAGGGLDALGGSRIIPVTELDVEYLEWLPDTLSLAS